MTSPRPQPTRGRVRILGTLEWHQGGAGSTLVALILIRLCQRGLEMRLSTLENVLVLGSPKQCQNISAVYT